MVGKVTVFNIMKKILYLLILLSLLIGMILPFAQSVYADTLYLRPNAAGDETYISGQYPYSTYHWDKVDEAVADEGSTYLYTGTQSYERDLYALSNPTGNGTINWIKVWIRVSGSNVNYPGYAKTSIKTGGTAYEGEEITLTLSYANYFTQYITNPQAGGAWTWAQLDDLQGGVALCTRLGYDVVCTQVYVEVDYTVAPTVTTNAATSVACTTATLNGSITATGGITPSNYGFVWDTTSRAEPSSATAPTASAYAGKWQIGAGSYPIGSYSHNIDTLTEGNTYYCRFAAYNTIGWAWGSELSFTCWYDPTITTNAATDVSVSTARLQSYLNNGGGTTCQVRFGWGTNNAGDNITAYNGTGSPSAYAGAYTTGQSPYLDIASLTAATTYYFNVQALNSCGTDTGTVTSFPTETSVGGPSNVIAIPSYNSVVLSWTKGTGAPNTLIRFRTNACPAHATPPVDGTLVYLGTASTYTHTNLTSGIDYCYYVRGYDSVEGYSSGYVVIHATTLAAGTVLDTTGTAIAKPSGMTGQPSISAALEGNIPIFPYIRGASTSTGIPMGNFVYILVLIMLSGLSYAVYKWTHSIEAIVIIWIFVSWVCYPTLHIPVIVPIFVSALGFGYGIYRIRSVI